MTKESLAALLNGREYGSEITRDEELEAAAAGLVVVFGASDDLMEFRGAIDDDIGAYRGYECTIDAKGPLPDFDDLISDRDKGALRDYFARENGSRVIKAVWDSEGYSWVYRTEIPHATFEVVEDGEKYCRGIVVALADLGGAE